MLVVTRYRVPREEAVTFRDQARSALQALAGQPGWKGGQLGRATDDPSLWVLSSQWRDVGSYRRALSSYDVKLHAIPLLSRAIDEPTAFELVSTLDADGGVVDVGDSRAADADEVGLGSAAAPVVPTDLDAGAGPEPAGGDDGRDAGDGR
ncbi:antibiotic biosynthesis monooxygenase [Actinobacteria bacterium YIM 96077]|uniref:Antibiotic biosynthesis monooxygenase n=2 Tax=Phytoactinopolyspora halophila TaxID=1981511 RepID=A0A329QGE0_9ACTN|nr:antibiotic biosynthesis monooxygenase [Actinobacteria bacterium YIM 96077]RAW11011.1 antibiotic biosynthesis monooxygenase [Phytoactinopolyspora halophila]